MKPQEAAQEKARAELREMDREWRRKLERCRCSRPIPDRLYSGRWLCRRCGKLEATREPGGSVSAEPTPLRGPAVSQSHAPSKL